MGDGSYQGEAINEAALSENIFLPVPFSEFVRFYDNAAD